MDRQATSSPGNSCNALLLLLAACYFCVLLPLEDELGAELLGAELLPLLESVELGVELDELELGLDGLGVDELELEDELSFLFRSTDVEPDIEPDGVDGVVALEEDDPVAERLLSERDAFGPEAGLSQP